MNYIGSKYSLIDFLKTSISKTLEQSGETRTPDQMVFADLLCGTAVVASAFKEEGYSIIANDIQYYSYVTAKHLIENTQLDEERCKTIIDKLNAIEGINGFIYNNYSQGGTQGKEFERLYFTDENAKKCDAMRVGIEKMKDSGEINENEYFFLLASIVNSIDKYANTASVYGAFLKHFKKTALKEMQITPMGVIDGNATYKVYNEDISTLIQNVSGDILYLDPPYNHRQYCTNYHLLETIAKYDNPEIFGKTGLREYSDQKSSFCVKSQVEKFLTNIIKNAKFKYIFLSYNNEGLLSSDAIEKIMKKHGKYKLYIKEYRRFKADLNRETKSDMTVEYLHCLTKK